MKVYSYSGFDQDGRQAKGEITAANLNNATVELYRKGISPEIISKRKRVLRRRDLFKRIVRLKEVIGFTRQLELMLKSGLPLIKSLSAIKKQENNPALKEVISDIISRIESGQFLSQAMGEHDHIFSDYYVNMIKAGEKAGILAGILGRIAQTLEKESTMIKDVRDALIYPSFILSVAFFVISMIIVFVIPVFEEMFSSFGSDLPYATKMVIEISRLMKDNLITFVLVSVLIFFSLRTLYRSEKGRLKIDYLVLKVPLAGKLLNKRNISSFSRTMFSMMESGLTISESLFMCAKTAKNRYVAEIIESVNTKISEGESLTEAFSQTGFFPPVLLSLIATGDETGSLSVMFKRLSSLLDEEIESTTKNFIKLLEPAVIIVTGIIIAALIISIYLPVFHLPGTMGS